MQKSRSFSWRTKGSLLCMRLSIWVVWMGNKEYNTKYNYLSATEESEMRYAVVDNATLTAVQRLLGDIPIYNKHAIDGDILAFETLIQSKSSPN